MYINDYYNVPSVIGNKISYNGRQGVICCDGGAYLSVNFDDDKPGEKSNIHPTDPGLVYLQIPGKIRRQTRSQRRYQRYKEYGDGFDSFILFCYWHDTVPEFKWYQ